MRGKKAFGPKKDRAAAAVGKPGKAEKKSRRSRWLRRAKPVIFTGCLLISVLLVLGSTMAWFTSADEVNNRVRREEPAKEFIVVRVDEFDDTPDASGLYEKHVGANNVGDLPAFVRLLVLPVFKSADGNLFPAVLGVKGANPGDPPVPPDANVIIKDFNLATWNGTTFAWEGGDWVDGGDGYYYYLKRLEPGDSTEALGENLFSQLELLTPTPAGYDNATLKIEVKCEAVEPKNYREAWWLLPGNIAPVSPPIPIGLLGTIIDIDDVLYAQIP